MKTNLQKIANSLYQQKKAVLYILCIAAYIIMVCIIKADAEAQTIDQTINASSGMITVAETLAAAPVVDIQTLANPNSDNDSDDTSDKAEYYRSMYGPKAKHTVTVDGHEFDIIPGAPYSVYEDMAKALETTETIEIATVDYYSENIVEVETGIVSVPEETTIEELVNETVEETVEEPVVTSTDATYTPGELRYHGVLRWGGSKWTWYSEKVLPGGGLDIPGRHLDDDGFVCDEEGYICLAADGNYIVKGTVIDTPFGRPGKIYDCGCDYGTVDVYVGW